MNIFECNPKLKGMSISNVLIKKKEREVLVGRYEALLMEK